MSRYLFFKDMAAFFLFQLFVRGLTHNDYVVLDRYELFYIEENGTNKVIAKEYLTKYPYIDGKMQSPPSIAISICAVRLKEIISIENIKEYITGESHE